MKNQYKRMELIYGPGLLTLLRTKRVAVFGIGGVGGYAVEALARSGVGTMDLFDHDTVDLTNLNRQIIALHSTIGKYKVEVAKDRIRDIDPDITVNAHRTFYLPDSPESEHPDFREFDYVIDAVDTVTAKISIITEAQKAGVPVISCMGCGNRVDPAKLVLCDIYETKNDPLARIMRRELRKRGVKSLKTVCSTEPAIRPLRYPDIDSDEDSEPAREAAAENDSIRSQRSKPRRRDVPGSTAFVPPAAGLLAASAVIRDLTQFDPDDRVKGR
ncbi:MAG: tRNA threonylcarbamoyladenosine dehydratase [Bilifractor sp.]|jgi:tRNA A37 threonylcarbamoyladenosine dehydratase